MSPILHIMINWLCLLKSKYGLSVEDKSKKRSKSKKVNEKVNLN